MILGPCGCAIIRYWFRAVQLVCLCTVAMMTKLSHLEGGRFECSEWSLVVSRGGGGGLMASIMSVLGHTVVSSWSDGSCIYGLCYSGGIHSRPLQ